MADSNPTKLARLARMQALAQHGRDQALELKQIDNIQVGLNSIKTINEIDQKELTERME